MEMQTCYLCWKTRCHQLMLARSRYSNQPWIPTPWRQRTEIPICLNSPQGRSPLIIPPLLYFCLVLFSCRLNPRIVNEQQSLPAAYGFFKLCNPSYPTAPLLMHPFPTDLCPRGWDSEPSEVVSPALGHDLSASGASSQGRCGEVERMDQKVLLVYFKTGRVQVVAKEIVSLFHVKCLIDE